MHECTKDIVIGEIAKFQCKNKTNVQKAKETNVALATCK